MRNQKAHIPHTHTHTCTVIDRLNFALCRPLGVTIARSLPFVIPTHALHTCMCTQSAHTYTYNTHTHTHIWRERESERGDIYNVYICVVFVLHLQLYTTL